MIVEFTVANYRSFLSAQTLSLVASKGGELISSNTFDVSIPNDFRLLHSAVIYGSNAAGKSNLLRAIQSMKRIVITSALQQRGDSLPVEPFKLNYESQDKPSEFEIIFIANNVRYQYGFSATKSKIYHEWLIAYPKGRSQKWFERIWEEHKQEYRWEMGSSLQGEKQLWQKATRDNALYLSTAVQLNSTQLQPIFDWFKFKLRTLNSTTLISDFTVELCENEQKNQVLDFLKTADLSIDDINIEKEKFDPDNLPSDMPVYLKEFITKSREDRELLNIKTLHKGNNGELISFDLRDESEGTKKVFSIAGPWINSLKNGNVLFVDELNNSLHLKLVKFLVQLFNNKKINPNNAQLVFTTHETSLLNQHETFRRDQVWFCEKNKNQSTKLYPLTDFSPRKGRENLEMAYLSGRYGALPYVKEVE